METVSGAANCYCTGKSKKVKPSRYRHADDKGRGNVAPTIAPPLHYIGVSGQRHAPAAL